MGAGDVGGGEPVGSGDVGGAEPDGSGDVGAGEVCGGAGDVRGGVLVRSGDLGGEDEPKKSVVRTVSPGTTASGGPAHDTVSSTSSSVRSPSLLDCCLPSSKACVIRASQGCRSSLLKDAPVEARWHPGTAHQRASTSHV